MLRKQLSRKILKALKTRNVNDFTNEGTCFPEPNFVWYIDGHDKLKLYGFSSHGCIEEFSMNFKSFYFK